MKILRWIAVAFSMYSRIPMPVFEWKDDDMSNGLMFFPFVGIVIGVISLAVYGLTTIEELPLIAVVMLMGLIPIVVTGGFHIDGFMDMTDALKSYQPTEKKLEILKDPHIGAFAVIGLVRIMLTYAIGVSLILVRWSFRSALVYGLIFVISRAVSGISSISLKKAKKAGMLYEETKHKSNWVLSLLYIQLIVTFVIVVYIKPTQGLALILTEGLIFAFYKHITYKQFGGVTGDTAGYLVTASEVWMVLVLGIMMWFGL